MSSSYPQKYFWIVFLLFAFLIISCSEKSNPGSEQKIINKGEKIYIANCKVCHAQGINGAPILGNKKMWSKRLPQDVEILVKHAIDGYGLMPAKGGNSALTTEEIYSAVSYMMEALN